jgi:DNA polymerase III alpha subunit
MTKRRKIAVSMSDLCEAFENCRGEIRYFLNLATGEIERINDEFMDSKEIEKLSQKIDDGLGERYIAIPESSSEEGYEDMQDFAETVTDESLQEKLCIALDGSGCFRQFKVVLLSYPNEREQWFKFKDSRLKERVNEWLEVAGIEVEVVNPIKVNHIT